MKNNKNKGAQDSANIRFDIPPLNEQERIWWRLFYSPPPSPKPPSKCWRVCHRGAMWGRAVSEHCKPAIKTEAFAWSKSAMAGRFAPPPISGFLMR